MIIEDGKCIKDRRTDWLTGYFGFNGSLRQHFSLYRSVFHRKGGGGGEREREREREKRETIGEGKK